MLPTTGSTITQAIWPLNLAKAASTALTIVVGQRQGELDKLLRYARRAGNAERCHAGAGLHQQRVAVSVIAAFELHNELAAGVRAGQPDRRHGRFGS